MSFGDRLRKSRIDCGYSQKQLAEIIGVKNTAISNYEKNTSFPNTDILYKLFNALGCEPNYLFWDELTDELKNKILRTNNQDDTQYRKLIDAYENHPEMQSAVNKLLDITDDSHSISDDIITELKKKVSMPTKFN